MTHCHKDSRLQSQTPLDVEMHVNDLAEFIFLKNVNDSIVYLTLNGLEDTKDLFFFCLDLFCKGLVLLYGNAENKVNLDDITMDMFNTIRKKLRNAKIDIILDIYQDIASGDEDNASASSLNLQHIEELPNALPLREYDFILRSKKQVFSIKFDMLMSDAQVTHK